MSIRASAFIATSVDGFIARLDGSIDWLDRANATIPEGEDCGYKAFFDSIDCIVMGRNTFELVRGFPEWPYADKPVVVLSSRTFEIPAALAPMVSSSSELPAELLLRLETSGYRRVYVDGGITIQRFLADGLIDDLTITLIPVLLGEGRPLFGPLAGDVELELLSTRSYEFGFVQLSYGPRKPETA
ncbi:MAG: dihydrofolate reductase family protein [Polyangiales bacterium]